MQRKKGRGRARRSRVAGAGPWLLLGLFVASACALTPDRLPAPHRQFYYNLPSDADKDMFLRIDDSQREAFLKQKGLWDRWTALPAAERAAAMNGQVEVGFHEFAAFMAWGPPADSQGTSERFHVYIRCTSGPHRGDYVHDIVACDGTSSELKLTVRDDVIVEIKHLN